MSVKSWILEKFNIAQVEIARDAGTNIQADSSLSYDRAYDNLPVVRRAIDLIVNGAASFDVDIKDKISGMTAQAVIRKTKLNVLLNFQSNLFIDINKFRRLIYLDLILDGNAYLYYDNAHLYNLPASNMEIITDPVTFVKAYKYNSSIEFKPSEIIHISDGSSSSIYKGTSRMKSTASTITSRGNMTQFQSNYFSNGAVPGLVLKSPNVLGDKIKKRMIESWISEYNPTRGGKRPMILDGGLELDRLADVNFKELDFAQSITAKDQELLVALGVPEVLITSGNNSNITPNLRLFYMETVLPLVRMVNSAYERFFAYDLEQDSSKVFALQPDLREEAGYYSTLVNGGVLTATEARTALRYPNIDGHDYLRIPANIAGSAAGDPAGGRPPDGTQ